MRNVSTKGEDIKLISDKCYYVIDALYLNNIKSEIDDLDMRFLDKDVEEKVFPYTEAPFAKITGRGLFQVKNIKKIKYEDINPNDKNYFSSDTGLIIFVTEESFLAFLEGYDFNSLVDTIAEDINLNYWDGIASKFSQNALGLILAPGIDSEYEFEGSGIYKIET
ncbi:MAG TPA: hypothetical protein VEA37_04070 [Flavobacterium sp.]|nr:hypothetical protein [Flavobacterium sp.]